MVAVLAFLVEPARDALHNEVPVVVLGLAVLLIVEQELLRVAGDDRLLRGALLPRAPIAALSLALGLIFILRLGEIAG
jgi:hypothetical protein